jgi:hypothetical protein
MLPVALHFSVPFTPFVFENQLFFVPALFHDMGPDHCIFHHGIARGDGFSV